MNRKSELIRIAKLKGLTVTVYSPGDGATRYRFSLDTGEKYQDYFCVDTLFTALGIREAYAYLYGFMDGRKER